MSMVKHRDKRTGVTYVYESESYWDKEKKQPRSRRKLIGKIDETTGEIVPTEGRGRKRKKAESASDENSLQIMLDECRRQLKEKELEITLLNEQIQTLTNGRDRAIRQLNGVVNVLRGE